MGDRRRLKRFLRSKLRSAGRQVEEARRSYESGRNQALAGLPTDEEGRAKLVCRRHAERRAVDLDEAARPVCYDPDSTDCQGCVEDIREGRIETWE
ncbi:DUF7091 family protein [Haloglomus salinum]|jgi:hypothetical protein|uniref:DUF7091 family protein n=1 Tax=Haloglomus salinum TaxID=2962673 RepID=UPI0020C9AEDB|nr:hypothetical protein [Haloglomus salinum]